MAKKTQTTNPNDPIDIFFDPDTGMITIHGEQVYQLRHAASGTKLQFNTKGELSR